MIGRQESIPMFARWESHIFHRVTLHDLESLILAQNERWRRA